MSLLSNCLSIVGKCVKMFPMHYCAIAGFLSHSHSINPEFQLVVNDCNYFHHIWNKYSRVHPGMIYFTHSSSALKPRTGVTRIQNIARSFTYGGANSGSGDLCLTSVSSYICFTTTSLDTVDIYSLLRLCTICQYQTTATGWVLRLEL